MKSISPRRRTTIGGQALIEGIFMMGPERSAIVVRGKDGLVEKVDEVKMPKERCKVLGWPLIRGVVSFGTSLKRGVSALMFSADYYPEEEGEAPQEPGKLDRWIEEKVGTERAEKILMGFTMVLGILMPIGLFILLPTLLAGLLDPVIGSGILRNLLEGALRILIFLGFIWLTSKQKDMKRVFAYHGAEHKTIHCYEAGEKLTVENVRRFPRQHPRCGTSFLFVVMIVSILVFSLVQWSNPWVRMALRIALLPVVVGISYEINRFAGRYDNWLTRALRAPGMWLQLLTTNEPDDGMMEVGIRSLQLVIPREEGADTW